MKAIFQGLIEDVMEVFMDDEKDELISTKTLIGPCVSTDYRKLNKDTRKDHFSLPFIDQMVDRLAGRCLLVCALPLPLFQCCMMAIFQRLIEDVMEVFMDDFFVFGSSFDTCLAKQFDFVVKDKKGCENMVVDYLSRNENENDQTSSSITEDFPEEQLYQVKGAVSWD
ncbi:uncharacterized protein LOC120079139 [Benincasa hispida]|uniref:uncharacterized protein LOC120079139 n=1 Tax=Benincasa hispida TaxID=102211 RepID=UPI001900A693|nr:uncharacterized protein LOC120079139 [Benincasa hispida]